MSRSSSHFIAIALMLLLPATALAEAGVPYGTAWAENCGRFTIAPGGGEDLMDPDAGNDYLIHVLIWDINGDPIITLVATDIWLDREDVLAPCPGQFSQADQGTDTTGYTSFSGTIFGGVTADAAGGIDCDAAELFVIVMGNPLREMIYSAPVPVCVTFDSPDLNGDGAVTLVDFALFVTDFNCTSGCDPCHDFNEDGFTNVMDFAIFGNYFNQSVCP